MVKIYSQGDLNGACFLFSIANAYKALSHKEITQRAWSKAMKEVFFLEDFMDSALGTARFNDNPDLFKIVIQQMLNSFSDKEFEVNYMKCNTISAVKKLISANSVAIFCFKLENDKGKEIINHWTCGVDVTEKPAGIQVACSSCKNEPQKSNNYNRWYNEIRVKENTTAISEVSVFQICRKS